jgi:hypothetical protein
MVRSNQTVLVIAASCVCLLAGLTIIFHADPSDSVLLKKKSAGNSNEHAISASPQKADLLRKLRTLLQVLPFWFLALNWTQHADCIDSRRKSRISICWAARFFTYQIVEMLIPWLLNCKAGAGSDRSFSARAGDIYVF